VLAGLQGAWFHDQRRHQNFVVDDEKQFVDTLAERLSMRGFEARVAYDGPQALKAVEQPTDVIVLDLRMPGMDGFEVLRNVKKSNPQVQVIILTGHGGDAEEQTAYRMGAYNFLKKPMDIDELLSSIRMAYRDKVEIAMVAVSLAEGGDFDAARDVLNEKDVLNEHNK
jgi:DNA-binding NtrC family response regulator